MEKTVRVIAEIPKEALLRLQKGELSAKGGGLREHGRMKYLPHVIGEASGESEALNKALQSVNGLKGAANNVLSTVKTMENTLQTIRGFQIANIAITGAGLAASIIGDVVIEHELKQMEDQLDQLLESNQELKKGIDQIRSMQINQKKERFDQLRMKLDNCIRRMQVDDVTDELLNETYNLLVDTRAFMNEMIQNAFEDNCREVDPTYLFNITPYYVCATSLLVINQALLRPKDKWIYSKHTLEDLQKPIILLRGTKMFQYLYGYFYDMLPGIPEEKTLLSFAVLPQAAFEAGKDMLDAVAQTAFSDQEMDDILEIMVPEELKEKAEQMAAAAR